MIQTRLDEDIEKGVLKIGDLVRLVNPYSEYERNLILRINRFNEDGFASCTNIKVKQSYYYMKISELEMI